MKSVPLSLVDIRPDVAGRVAPFAKELLNESGSIIHSLHLVGSAVTPDYIDKISDVNLLVVLDHMDFGFLRFLASIGKIYKKKGIAAPLIMTSSYIGSSLDVFPIEFLDLSLIHKTIYKDDILKDLHIDMQHLRLQCEREIKTKLLGLRQGYVATLDNKHLLVEGLSRSITGYLPLFRAIVRLMGEESPVPKYEAIDALGRCTGIKTDIFKTMLLLKQKKITLSKHDIAASFEDYYRATEKLGDIIDELQVEPRK